MIIWQSEIEIILNELLARGKKEIILSPLYGNESIFNYNLENQKLFLKTSSSKWKSFMKEIIEQNSLSKEAIKELPEFNDIIKAVTSSGLLIPEGIDDLIDEIKKYLVPSKRINRRKRFLIALDTNQLIDNLMSCYIEKEFSSIENIQARNFISYVISSWVTYERDCFLRTEKNRGINELDVKFKQIGFNLREKIDKRSRLGYSIFSELKSLEESYHLLECKMDSNRRNEVIRDKNLKDQAIIDEYEDYKKSLKDIKFVYVTSDDQSFGISKIESIKIKVPMKIPSAIECCFENGAKLIYQLTLFLGFLKINNYKIRFDIYYPGKEHNDWENRKLKFNCSDKTFEERIKNLIKLTRKFNSICNN